MASPSTTSTFSLNGVIFVDNTSAITTITLRLDDFNVTSSMAENIPSPY